MKFIVKAVVYGFSVSLGSALFKKIQHKIGLGDPNEKTADVVKPEGANDPNLQDRLS